MYQIIGLDLPVVEPIITLSEKESLTTKDWIHKGASNKPIIGLNTGAGNRWLTKNWHISKWEKLIELLLDYDLNIYLLGGPSEKSKNDSLAEIFPDIIHTGCENTLRDFFCIVNACNVIVTTDTLALHVATAFKKKVVALFGPTSDTESELYGKV